MDYTEYTPGHKGQEGLPTRSDLAITPTPTPLVHDAYQRKTPYSEGIDEKKTRSSSSLNSQKKRPVDPVVAGENNALAAKEDEEIEQDKAKRAALWRKARRFVLPALALLILGWWISATILPGTRNRWYVHPHLSTKA